MRARGVGSARCISRPVTHGAEPARVTVDLGLGGQDAVVTVPPLSATAGTEHVRLALGSDPQGSALARAFARDALEGWGLGALSDDMLLVVSELIGNSLRYGASPVVVTIWRVAGQVRVNVTDGGAGAPLTVPSMAASDAVSGRGLAIVAAVADDLDVSPARDTGGLSVTVSFRTA